MKAFKFVVMSFSTYDSNATTHTLYARAFSFKEVVAAILDQYPEGDYELQSVEEVGQFAVDAAYRQTMPEPK